MGVVHVIYIPLIFIGGLATGWFLGTRGAVAELNELRRRLSQTEEDAAKARARATRAGGQA